MLLKLEVLLLRWMKNLDLQPQYQLFDLFSGHGEVSRVWCLGRCVPRASMQPTHIRVIVCMYYIPGLIDHSRHERGYKVASFDKLYGRSMDFLSKGGFALQACNRSQHRGVAYSIDIYMYVRACIPSRTMLDPRLAMFVVCCEVPDALNLIGPDCGSWGVPARYTSGRSYVNAFGHMSRQFVASNNCIISRPQAVLEAYS